MLEDAKEAHVAFEVGIINCVVPRGEYLEGAMAMAIVMAQSLAEPAPLAVQAIKRSTAKTLPKAPTGRAYPEVGTVTFLVSSGSVAEGIRAFRENRAQKWRGR